MRDHWRVASAIFTALLAAAGVFLAFDAFEPVPAQHALMNAEGIVALSFLALLFARSGERQFVPAIRSRDALIIAAIIIITALAFAPILHTPFLYDDYTHITDASRSTWRSVVLQFGRTPGQGLFFRPFGFLLYWLNYLWVGSNSAWWHAGNILLHALCCVFTYLLCREIALSWTASAAGALLFGLNGVAAEAVAWIDAGFVALTTALVLLSLIFVCRYTASGRTFWMACALASGACAMLSKEIAFCLPLLLASLALFHGREHWQRIVRATLAMGLLAATLFAYRWWALRGIGGYAGTYGNVSILHFNLIRTLDALLLRQWAVLFFPVNWSVSPGVALRAALAATPLVLAACCWMSKPPRRQLLGCIAFIVAAALPVEHLLLISPDLGGSRTLYLGAVGWALLWAFMLDAMRPTWRITAAGVLLLLQLCVLEHDLGIWCDTAELARSTCIAFGRTAAADPGRFVVRGLPATRDGTVFLRNGFPQCVELNTGVAAWRIQTPEQGIVEQGAREFVWNDAQDRIEPAPPR